MNGRLRVGRSTLTCWCCIWRSRRGHVPLPGERVFIHAFLSVLIGPIMPTAFCDFRDSMKFHTRSVRFCLWFVFFGASYETRACSLNGLVVSLILCSSVAVRVFCLALLLWMFSAKLQPTCLRADLLCIFAVQSSSKGARRCNLTNSDWLAATTSSLFCILIIRVKPVIIVFTSFFQSMLWMFSVLCESALCLNRHHSLWGLRNRSWIFRKCCYKSRTVWNPVMLSV